MREINKLLKKLHKKKDRLIKKLESSLQLDKEYCGYIPPFNSELHTKLAKVGSLITELESLINIHREAFNIKEKV